MVPDFKEKQLIMQAFRVYAGQRSIELQYLSWVEQRYPDLAPRLAKIVEELHGGRP